MYVYGSERWHRGLLDPAVVPGTVRVTVLRQIPLCSVDDQFFVRSRDLRMVAAYLRRLGPRRVLRKIRSRRSESLRNDAWISIGLGRTDDGRPVAFIAPNHALAAERIVTAATLVRPVEIDVPSTPRHHGHVDGEVPEPIRRLGGWVAQSGAPAAVIDDVWDEVLRRCAAADDRGLLPPPPPSSPVQEHVGPSGPSPDPASTIHCFGYGQYAKTQAIPNLTRHLTLVGVHEIDPRQIGPVPDGSPIGWDTSPLPRDGEPIRNAIVAGYHHLHAPLAVDLLDRGARHVVIEKPIATTTDQLDDLIGALERHGDGRVHVAFQRRYSPLNDALRRDLGAGPLSMSATVFEVPLPPNHWYRWPIVGNAVVSNGCHWIDHFLHLNDYAEPVALGATRLGSQIVLTLDLENGASAVISLRHEGSARIGVRDHVTFWSGDATAVIDDLHHYGSDHTSGRTRVEVNHPYRGLEQMYEVIGRKIASDEPGDPVRSLRVSGSVTLALAALLDEEDTGC